MDMRWKAGGISVAGFAHIDEGIPCQDAHAFEMRDDGWFVAAVADGAGSAAKSHTGAQAYVSSVVSYFATQPELPSMAEDVMAAAFIREIDATTRRLVEADGDEPVNLSKSDFAATVIMVVCHQEGGAFFHVGDGAGVALKLADMALSVVSKPENGEYANETYFVTMDGWEEHLRVTAFDSTFDTVLLMSDGATPMAMTKGCEAPFPEFVRPVINFLQKAAPENGVAALRNTLTRDQVRTITGDDKTLVWALKPLSPEA